MISHDHSRFSDPSFDPCPMPIDSMLQPDTFDSMAVDDDSIWILCASCNRLRVEREGDTCKLCTVFLNRAHT